MNDRQAAFLFWFLFAFCALVAGVILAMEAWDGAHGFGLLP